MTAAVETLSSWNQSLAISGIGGHIGRSLLDTGKNAAVTNTPTGDSGINLIVCYTPGMISTNGIFLYDSPLDYAVPLLMVQCVIIIAVTRGLHFLFRVLRQPTFVADVLGGIIVGPSVLGHIPYYSQLIFPVRGIVVLEAIADLGLLYFIFLVGLEIDLKTINNAGKRAWVLTAAGMILPFAVETMGFLIFGSTVRSRVASVDSYLVFVGVSLSITAYPVLVRVLAEVKLLHTETGKLAMSAAVLNDGLAWVLLALAIALSTTRNSIQISLDIILSAIVLVVLVYFLIRPAAKFIESKIKEGQSLDEVYVMAVLVAVMACGIASDAIGVHAVFGAFAMGVVFPDGPLAAIMVEKLEDFVSCFLMPLFFGVIGTKVNTATLTNPGIYGFLIGVIITAAVARVGITFFVSMFYALTTREGLCLGILMNSKGIMELIVLHIAFDKRVLDTQSYTTMILMSVLMTALVTPLAKIAYRPPKDYFAAYKRRMIYKSRVDAELRLVACVHTNRNVAPLISLLQVSNPTKRSPIFVYALHLIELTGRESAMLIVHDTQHEDKHRDGNQHQLLQPQGGGMANLKRVQAQSEQIIKSFETYEQHSGGVSVQPMTIASAYSSMHEDVSNVAEDKHAALLVLPFHKQHTVDGSMDVINPGIKTLNMNVLNDSPCSVAILVDRGFGAAVRNATGGMIGSYHVALLFVGGPDDREALSYASRMAEHPGVYLTVIRFVDARAASSYVPQGSNSFVDDDDSVASKGSSCRKPMQEEQSFISRMSRWEKEAIEDDECVKEFRIRTINDNSVVYMEKPVMGAEGVVSAIRNIESAHDLYVVGRSVGVESPLMVGLGDWAESPELGAIGDLLASSDFSATVSLLIIQQYKGNRDTAFDD